MALVTMKEMLEDARQRKYAVGAFDVSNYEMIRATVEVAEELKAPVILSVLQPDIEGVGLDYFAAMLKVAATTAKVPVCIHLDHAVEFESIKRVIDYGFSSVMYDGSVLPFEENAKNTKEVCDYAHKLGITVEAELGHVTDAIAGCGEGAMLKPEDCNVVEDPEEHLTNPDEVKRFIEITDVDALAVAIGTAHGVYTSKPKMHFDRLDEINRISRVPLVLHGGSGTPDMDIKRTIELGICKINIFSEVLYAFNTTMKSTLDNLNNMSSWPILVYEEPIKAMKAMIEKKIVLFDSNGKA